MPKTATQNILTQLKGVRQVKPNRWEALCPAHADSKPSLSIAEADDRLLVKCFAGCKFEDILKPLGLQPRDLFFDKNGGKPQRPEIVEEKSWDIVDITGKLIAQHVRLDYTNEKKSFVWRHDGKTGLGELKTENLPLYGLRWAKDEPIDSLRDWILVEGEKACDALHKAGFMALGTVTGASGCPSRESLYPLLGRQGHVLLWPDNDDTGRAHMSKIAERLKDMDVEVFWLDWRGASPKGDAYDFLQTGGDVEAFLKTACKWGTAPTARRVATLADIRSYYGAVDFLWKPWLPVGHVTLIVGPQAVGKSYFTAYIVAALAGALKTWPDGQKAPETLSKVLFLETEEMRGAYAQRWANIGMPDECVVLPIENDDIAYVPRLPGDYEKILGLGKHEKVRAVVLDSLSGGHGVDENSDAMRGIMQSLVKLAGEFKVPVIVVHHLRKRNQFEVDGVTLDRVRGSSTITQFCRSVIGLSKIEGGESVATIRVESLKSSFAKPPGPFGFDITDDGLTFGPAPEAPKQETILERACEFLRIQLHKEPQRYGDLIENEEASGISRATLYRAKDALRINVVNGFWTFPDPEK